MKEQSRLCSRTRESGPAAAGVGARCDEPVRSSLRSLRLNPASQPGMLSSRPRRQLPPLQGRGYRMCPLESLRRRLSWSMSRTLSSGSRLSCRSTKVVPRRVRPFVLRTKGFFGCWKYVLIEVRCSSCRA